MIESNDVNSAQSHSEHDFEEVMDISHLSQTDQKSVAKFVDSAHPEKVNMPDDPSFRAACHGHILSKLGYDISDPEFSPVKSERELSPEKKAEILAVLQKRFEANKDCFKDIGWEKIKAALELQKDALWSISKLEELGHQPEVLFAERFGFTVGSGWKKIPKVPLQDMCSYNEAESMAQDAGVDLMNPNENIKFQTSRDKTYDNYRSQSECWLKTTNELLLKTGHAYCGKVIGCDNDKSISITPYDMSNRISGRSWRGVLKVLWAE